MSEEIPWNIFLLIGALAIVGIVILILLAVKPDALGGWLGGFADLLQGKWFR